MITHTERHTLKRSFDTLEMKIEENNAIELAHSTNETNERFSTCLTFC
jgi:hypothetical protein